MERSIVELNEVLEHKRDRRYALTDSVRKHRKDSEADRAKNRADYALAQFQVERDVRSLVEKMKTARREISQMSRKVSPLRVQIDRLQRVSKNLIEILEHGSYLNRRKRARTDGTGGDAPRKT